MNHEMEEHCGSCPQDTVDAGSTQGGGFERLERFESSKGCLSEQEGGRATTSNSSNPSNPSEHDKLEERVRRDCRRTCRRNLFVELLKTVAKVAGVILAAMGLSSFGEED